MSFNAQVEVDTASRQVRWADRSHTLGATGPYRTKLLGKDGLTRRPSKEISFSDRHWNLTLIQRVEGGNSTHCARVSTGGVIHRKTTAGLKLSCEMTAKCYDFFGWRSCVEMQYLRDWNWTYLVWTTREAPSLIVFFAQRCYMLTRFYFYECISWLQAIPTNVKRPCHLRIR